MRTTTTGRIAAVLIGVATLTLPTAGVASTPPGVSETQIGVSESQIADVTVEIYTEQMKFDQRAPDE